MNESEKYRPRILIVDDEVAIVDEIRDILGGNENSAQDDTQLKNLDAKLFGGRGPESPMAFDLTTCHQGDEAVETVRTALERGDRFSVAFLDVRMPPGPDGVWTAEQIRTLDTDIQIVMVTAYSDVDPADIASRVQPADKLLYLQKPFHVHEIRQFASALSMKWLTEKNLRGRTEELEKTNEDLTNEIQEHKRTEQKRKLLSRAIMSTDDCVYILDIDNKVIFANRAFCEKYGYDQDEILGKDDSVLWGAPPAAGETTEACQAVAGWEVAFFHKRKDDTEFPVSISKTEVKDESGDLVALVVITRDVSERMRVELKLRNENIELKRQNELAGELVTAALEQVKSPLAALSDIVSDCVQAGHDDIATKIRENIELAEKNMDRATRIAGEFCEASEINDNKPVVGAEQV